MCGAYLGMETMNGLAVLYISRFYVVQNDVVQNDVVVYFFLILGNADQDVHTTIYLA